MTEDACGFFGGGRRGRRARPSPLPPRTLNQCRPPTPHGRKRRPQPPSVLKIAINIIYSWLRGLIIAAIGRSVLSAPFFVFPAWLASGLVVLRRRPRPCLLAVVVAVEDR